MRPGESQLGVQVVERALRVLCINWALVILLTLILPSAACCIRPSIRIEAGSDGCILTSYYTREGNGLLLQCSCLENPRNGGAWWAGVYGVAQSRTRLKRLSSSSSSIVEEKGTTCRRRPPSVINCVDLGNSWSLVS